LGSVAEVLVDDFGDVWSINSIVEVGGTVYVGTSPNGCVYEYSLGRLKKLYSARTEERSGREVGDSDSNQPAEANTPGEGEKAEAGERLANEHIFAMSTDVVGRLLIGVSGRRCALCRLEGGELKTIFEPNDANYIFAIAVDEAGGIYMGTGPEGKVYRLDSFGGRGEVVLDSPDKNILSLVVGQDGHVYAGSDSRGLVYKIDSKTKDYTVLYDSDQEEVTSLVFCEGGLYAAATSASIVAAESKFAAQVPQAGRPEVEKEGEDEPEDPAAGGSGGGLQLKIANTKEEQGDAAAKAKKPPRKLAKPSQASFVYRISEEGFVTDVFSETAVFFCLARRDGKLLVGTGNSGQLFSVEPDSEQGAIIYEDKRVSQITAAVVSGDDVYVGTSNPAKLIKIGRAFAREGTYLSDLVDAGQPARWGKLQIDADVPNGCRVSAACRSGNVKDVNDPSFSGWSELRVVTGPIELECPLGRFCQYKLVLRSEDGGASPVVREVAVASTVPNVAPKVEAVNVSRIDVPGKTGVFKISYETKDENNDKLIYTIDFRKVGRANWIEIVDEIEADNFEWDGKTVEDGRYEIRVTASDERSNTAQTKLADSRISDAVVVDNTGPVVAEHSVMEEGRAVTLKLSMSDEFSVIGKVDYTVDSDAEWKGVICDDFVCDTTKENFTIVISGLEVGEHVVTVRTSDDVGNTTYKSFEIDV